MDDADARVQRLLLQQAAIAGFGSFALRQHDLLKVLTEAARVCAEGLGVPFSKICRYRALENDLLVEAGYGWEAGVVGHTVSSADETSPQGRAFVTGNPSICNDLRKDGSYVLQPVYAAHGIISTLDVIIKGDDKPYGVLEIDNVEQHDYDQHDIDFLTGFANVLAEAVATSMRAATLRATIEQMTILVESLEKSEERLRNMIEASPNIILMTDMYGEIEMLNPKAEQVFGHARSDLIGKMVLTLMPDRFRGSYSEFLARFVALPLSYSLKEADGAVEWICLRKDETEFEVEIRLNHIETNEGPKVLWTMVDISARMQLETKLRQAQKLEAVGRLAAGIAHDFNNILQGIIGGLELILDEIPEESAARAFASSAINATMRGASLTHQLLSYARKQILRPQVVDVTAFLVEMRTLLARTLGPHIEIPDPANPLSFVLADPGQLQTALLNLAINASHAMPRGGKLGMKLREERHGETKWAVIVMTDTGAGMDETTLALAAEPFFTTKGLEGSGLGLSMVQGFAEQSGGHLRLESAVGIGTTVELWLPAVTPGVLVRQTAAPEAGVSSGRILLVDDAEDILSATGAFLLKEGFKVVTANSGDKALAMLIAGECFDAIVSDYAMPGLNGIDLIKKARVLQPELKAILITGYSSASTVEIPVEGMMVLNKPFQHAALLRGMRRIMGQRPGSLPVRNSG